VRSRSAEDALLEAPRHSLALMTLDLGMYGVNGWQLLKQMRESGMLAQVPVIIATGRTIDDVAESRGAAAVLKKPIRRAQLKGALAKLGLLNASRSPFAS